jgi:hypothetical protein
VFSETLLSVTLLLNRRKFVVVTDILVLCRSALVTGQELVYV